MLNGFSEGIYAVHAGHHGLLRYSELLLLAYLIFAPVTLVLAISVNDPFVPEQWGWYRIKADKAYDTGYHGEGVVVAVLDTGVDSSHPDLAANIVGGWNFVENNDNITDIDGHGTMVSGIIAAAANNGIGIVGVAPNVSIMPLKVLSESGENWAEINSAIRYAADNGARVISMSFGGNYSRLSRATEAAIDYAYGRGCVLVAGAGNDNSSELFYPAAYDHVIAVSAIDQMDKRASFSNYGGYIDFCAPGVDILTTIKGGEYTNGSGTSFSTPFVTGVVALMLSEYPYLSPDEVSATLRVQVEDLGEVGWDPYFGWGLVNAYSAVSQNAIPESSNTVLFVLIISGTIMIQALKKRESV